MARWKADRKEATRRRILEAAAHLFRERGYASTSVSDVMEHLGLTVGGFYAHFESKEALLSEVVAESMVRTRDVLLLGLEQVEGIAFVREVTQRYLSRFHRDHPEHGCVLPTLAAEVGRHGSGPREAVEQYLREMTDLLAKKASPRFDAFSAEEAALALTALSVGGILLARAVKDEALSDTILETCRRFAVAEPARR